uniref:Uncharacterized protein n=2 Tax=Odontella aurita TaxID=265563 RepID=A0A6U6E7N4_9STRA
MTTTGVVCVIDSSPSWPVAPGHRRRSRSRRSRYTIFVAFATRPRFGLDLDDIYPSSDIGISIGVGVGAAALLPEERGSSASSSSVGDRAGLEMSFFVQNNVRPSGKQIASMLMEFFQGGRRRGG